MDEATRMRFDGLDERLDRIESKLDGHLETHANTAKDLLIASLGWLFALIYIVVTS